jgi:UDP-sugar transporter A1/2/3
MLPLTTLYCHAFAAVVLNMGGPASSSAAADTNSMYQIGLLCVAAASMLSGLSAALTQRAVTGSGGGARNTLLLSAEMAVYGIIFLLINLVFNNDTKGSGSLLTNWNLPTLIPVITNVRVTLLTVHTALQCSLFHPSSYTQAFGGMVVGLVTKYAGGVVKGFALIAGTGSPLLRSNVNTDKSLTLAAVIRRYPGDRSGAVPGGWQAPGPQGSVSSSQ